MSSTCIRPAGQDVRHVARLLSTVTSPAVTSDVTRELGGHKPMKIEEKNLLAAAKKACDYLSFFESGNDSSSTLQLLARWKRQEKVYSELRERITEFERAQFRCSHQD
jgi:rRNA-processing protein FCF1